MLTRLNSRRVSAHRAVLYAASEFFQAMFTTDMKERDSSEVSLQAISGVCLRQLVDFCYIKQIHVDLANADDILASAHLFGLAEVVAMCKNVYLDAVNATNALSLLAIADRYALDALLATTRTFAHDHFTDVVASEHFLDLDKNRLVELLECDAIAVDSEEDVFNALIRWIEHDEDERKQHYSSLIKCVRMSKISSKVRLL